MPRDLLLASVIRRMLDKLSLVPGGQLNRVERKPDGGVRT
jgi:hypothetical protein